ncbi:DUF397 domain-containing protein [Actinomycetota bacterium Odt1-20B]
MSTAELAWFKSSYSSDQGDSCIEVALDWHKSSYSGTEGDDCVEVATCPTLIHVRDSKDTARPHFTFTPGAWRAFLDHARR